MRTKNSMRHLAWGVLGLVTQQVFSQATQDDNNGGFNSFLGWNAGANQVLEVKNDANQPIEWYTDAIHRMTLRESDAAATVYSWSSLDLSGHLGIGGDAADPLTYIHISRHSSPPSRGYRPSMKTGLFAQDSLFTSAYFGIHRLEDGPRSSMLTWSQLLGAGAATQFSFKFMSYLTGQAGTDAGLEIARMVPDDNGNEGYFGIGDFQAATDDPTERLVY